MINTNDISKRLFWATIAPYTLTDFILQKYVVTTKSACTSIYRSYYFYTNRTIQKLCSNEKIFHPNDALQIEQTLVFRIYDQVISVVPQYMCIISPLSLPRMKLLAMNTNPDSLR